MITLMKRELQLAVGAGSGTFTAMLFFLAIVMVVPFGVGPDPKLLAVIGPAILWTGALLASLLGLDRFFRTDFEDGTLDQFGLSSTPLAVLVLVKSVVHWLVTGLPLTLLSPVFALLLAMKSDAIAATFITLLVGTPAISFIGAVGAALTVSLPRGGLLLSVLVLPLCVPVVIFGVGAVRGAVTDPDPFLPPFLMLSALSLFFIVLGPLASAIALKQGRS